MRSILKAPSPAMVVACIALAVSLSGTGYAAIKLERNSVGTRELKNNAVNSVKVRNGSLLRQDFRSGQIPAGPAGPAGPQGAKGDKGDAGVVGAITVRTGSVVVEQGSPTDSQYVTRQVQVLCAAGEKAISAGTSWSDDNNDLELTTAAIRPVLDATSQIVGYVARGGNDSGQTSTFTLHVSCYRG
jgi:hypothetical protein